MSKFNSSAKPIEKISRNAPVRVIKIHQPETKSVTDRPTSAGQPTLPSAAKDDVETPKLVAASSRPVSLAQPRETLSVQIIEPERSGGSAPEALPASINDVRPNGDEPNVRMEEIAKILGYQRMHLLDRYGLVAEWVHYAEAKLSVYGQIVPKPQGGRPESGIARAARELPLPAKSPEARVKHVRRALKIAGIRDEAKTAARAAGLDNIQAALLAIAKETSLEKQLARVKELAEDNSQPRGRRKTGASERSAAPETNTGASSEIIALESLSDEQQLDLAVLKTSWTDDGLLKREEWEKSDRAVQRQFARDLLLMAVAP